MIGFVLLVIGNLTYNEVIEWPCLIFKRGMGKYQAKIKDKRNVIYKQEKLVTKDEVMRRELARGSFLRAERGNSAHSQSGLNSQTDIKLIRANSWNSSDGAMNELGQRNTGNSGNNDGL